MLTHLYEHVPFKFLYIQLVVYFLIKKAGIILVNLILFTWFIRILCYYN